MRILSRFLSLLVLVLSPVMAWSEAPTTDGRNTQAVAQCTRKETADALAILLVNSGWSEKRWAAYQTITSCYDATFVTEKSLIRDHGVVKEVTYQVPELGLTVIYAHGSVLSASIDSAKEEIKTDRVSRALCSSRQQSIQARIATSNYCVSDADCERVSLIGSSCQFHCEAVVNKDLAKGLFAEIQKYEQECPSTCDYKCPAIKADAPTCKFGKCG